MSSLFLVLLQKRRYGLCLNEEGQWVTKESGGFCLVARNERNDATRRANEFEERRGREGNVFWIVPEDESRVLLSASRVA